jgi:hypothetical protein
MKRTEGSSVLVVEVIFHVSDEQHGRTVASQMVDRAHEIANLPECECDLDVNVRWDAAQADLPQTLE